MDILLMRHSRTTGNIQRRYVGATDEPLCEEGIALAHDSGIDTGTAIVYVSPLSRARETARIKFPNAQLNIVGDLKEMDFGDFEGRTASEMERDEAYVKWLESRCTLPCPNGEGITDFSDRVCAAFDGIVRACIKNGDKQLVIVAHGGSIMSILSRYAKPEREYYEWYVDNCCGYRTQLDEASWNDSPVLTEMVKFETHP
jgi:alpha-ribazole phosphatase